MKKGFLKTAMKVAAAGVVAAGVTVPAFTLHNNEAQAQVPPSFVNSFAPLQNAPVIHPELASNSTEPVGLRLISVFDVSGSINDVEYQVQLEAMADALESDDFKNAVFYEGGPQSIALAFIDFDDETTIRIGWVDIRKGEEWKLDKLADEVRSLERTRNGMTDHVPALQLSKFMLDNAPWEARRNVIDVLTDGENHKKPAFDAIRETLARENEATINALITDTGAGIVDWAWDYLVTQPGHARADGSSLEPGFVKVVATEASEDNPGQIVKYRRAMELAYRRKIVLEIAGLQLEDLRHRVLTEQQGDPTSDFSAAPQLPYKHMPQLTQTPALRPSF